MKKSPALATLKIMSQSLNSKICRPPQIDMFSSVVSTIKERSQSLPGQQVMYISSPPGTGKSTSLPISLAEAGLKVMLSEPTIVSVENLQGYVKYLAPDFKIGYAADRHTNYQNTIATNLHTWCMNRYREDPGRVAILDDDNIIYATSGHVVSVMQSLLTVMSFITHPLPVKFVDVIIIDESHLPRLDNTLIEFYWQKGLEKARSQGLPYPQLIKVSATPPPGVTVFKIDNPPRFDQTIYYLEAPVERENLYHYIAQELIQELEADTYRWSQAPENYQFCFNWLVFLPGLPEIRKCQAIIQQLSDAFDVHILHSSVKWETMKKCLETPDPAQGKQKVILSTNIAETSVTIDNLAVVIDSMLEKTTHYERGFPVMRTQFISQVSAQQRLGRIGRVVNGIYLRMVTRQQYNDLSVSDVPHVLYHPIQKTILNLVTLNLPIRDLLVQASLTINEPFNTQQGRVNRAEKDIICQMQTMHQLGLLYLPPGSQPSLINYTITNMGSIVSHLPVSYRLGALVVSWMQELGLSKTFPILVVVSVLDSDLKSMFKQPRQDYFEPIYRFIQNSNELDARGVKSQDVDYSLSVLQSQIKICDSLVKSLRSLNYEVTPLCLPALNQLLEVLKRFQRFFIPLTKNEDGVWSIGDLKFHSPMINPRQDTIYLLKAGSYYAGKYEILVYL